MLHLNARIASQPACLSSFRLGEPPHCARFQQYVHPQKSQTRQLSGKRKHGCCTCATQSVVDALGGKGQPAPQRAWWNDHQELWAAVHSPEELDQELTGNGKDLVVVGGRNVCNPLCSYLLTANVLADFYGTWCVGCAKVYPEVCRVAADPTLRQKCHFVKVPSTCNAESEQCFAAPAAHRSAQSNADFGQSASDCCYAFVLQVCVDSMKERMKADGVRSLPYLAFYSPSGGKMVGYVNLPSRSRLLRANIDKLLQNRGAKFALDPNGFVVVTESAESRALNTEEEMEINLQDMQKEREELFAGPSIPVFSSMLNWVKVTMSGDEQSR